MDNRRAGRSTRELAERRRKASFQIYLIVSAGIVSLLVLLFVSKPAGVGVLAIFVGVLLLFLMGERESAQVDEMARRAIRGAEAEEEVASILDNLGEGFLVLHDIPSPYGNIDHVVISRQSGIFLIETKAHGGRVSIVDGQLLINGHPPEKDFVAQALKNTYWLREQIQGVINAKVWIIALIVFTNAFVEPGPAIKNVLIINKKYLPKVLHRPITRAQNPTLWQNRERIRQALYAVGEPVFSKTAR